jgi:hypothetical protein
MAYSSLIDEKTTVSLTLSAVRVDKILAGALAETSSTTK